MGTRYKENAFSVEFDAETLDSDETKWLLESWDSIRKAYNKDGRAFIYLNETDFAFYKASIQIMKAYFKGAKFVGLNPNEGEFGVRQPLVEDLVGATDTEWGATTAGTGTWTAGQRGWLHTAAQNSDTYANVLEMRLRDSTGAQEWSFLMFGMRSLSVQPVVKDLLVTMAGSQMPIQQMEHQLRGSGMRLAKFDGPMFFHPQRSFKIGVTVRTAAQDQIYPLGVVILTGIRGKDLTVNRPSAA